MAGPGAGRRPEPGQAGAQLLATQAEVASFASLQVGYEQERRTLITIEAMRSLSRMLGGLPGRKNVAWLTANFPSDLIPQDPAVRDAKLTADLPNIRHKSLQATAAG